MTLTRQIIKNGRHLILMVVLVLLIGRGSAVYAQTPPGTVGVYYVGQEDRIAHAIDLAAPYLVRVNQPDLARVIVINNAFLEASLSYFSEEIQAGRLGLVLFSGSHFPQDIEDLRALLGVGTFQIGQTDEPAVVRASNVADPLQRTINWRSAPEIEARTIITNPNLLRPIIVTAEQQALIQRVRGREETQAFIVGPWLTHASNETWSDWAYFDFLIYRLIVDAADAPRPLSFADYPISPAPERRARWVVAGLGSGLILGTGLLFYVAKRRFFLRPDLATSWRRLTARSPRLNASSPWTDVGFHRPLAGFLAFAPLALFLLVPLIFYEIFLLPRVLMPGAQGIQAWQTVVQWTAFIWILFDAGAGVAAIRAFSAHRTHFPQEAPRYLQFYAWWQFLSGAGQLGVICLITAITASTSSLAHLAYYVLARAALQFPGFLWIFALTFRARQRFDEEQFLNVLYMILSPLLQGALILVLRPWGATQPSLGAGLASVLGLAAGLYVAEGAVFLLGAALHRRDGYAWGTLFVPTFDRDIIRELLSFGLPWALAAALPALSLLLQSVFLYQGTTWTGPLVSVGAGGPFGTLRLLDVRYDDWRLILQFTAGYEILLIGLYRSLMPALTEALVLNYRTLLRYYISQGIRYGAWFSFFLFAALSAVGGPIIERLFGPNYHGTLVWLLPMLIWGALRWASWLPDRLLEAAGRPSLILLLTLVEEVLRVGGLLILATLWQAEGAVIAYTVALIVRILLARVIVGRVVAPARMHVWQTLVVPAVSALFIYQLLRIASLVWPASTVGTMTLATVGLLIVFPIYAFVTSVLGGWDDGELRDFRRAMSISAIGYPFAWLLYSVMRLGANLSPLHGRFSVGHYELAQEEARALTFAQMTPE